MDLLKISTTNLTPHQHEFGTEQTFSQLMIKSLVINVTDVPFKQRHWSIPPSIFQAVRAHLFYLSWQSYHIFKNIWRTCWKTETSDSSIRENNLKPLLKKYRFFINKVKCVGHAVSEKNMEHDPDKLIGQDQLNHMKLD